MAHLTYSQLVHMMETDPLGCEALRLATGMTPRVAAAKVWVRISDAQRAGDRLGADRILSEAARLFNVSTSGLAGWAEGTGEILRTAGDDRDAIHRKAERLSEESERGMYVPAERIEKMLHHLRQSALQQGISSRLRESDTRAGSGVSPVPERAAHRAWADDQRDRRAALNAAVAGASAERHLTLHDEHDNVHDSLAAAFEAHANREAMLDPLDDDRLLSLSDAL